jgi:hypothetical protein
MIYEGSPQQQLSYVASILATELRHGSRCLYLNSPDLVLGLRTCLAHSGIDVDAEIKKGALILSSERTHLANGRFSAQLMLDDLAALSTQAQADGFQKLWASGDMTWEFGNRKNFTELLTYERGLERLFHQHPILNGICQYRQDTLPTSAIRDALSTHQSVYLNQTLFRLNPYFNAAANTARTSPIPTDIKDLLERFRLHQ